MKIDIRHPSNTQPIIWGDPPEFHVDNTYNLFGVVGVFCNVGDDGAGDDDDDDDGEDIPGNGDLPTALHTINLYILQSVAGSHLFIIIINRQQCKVLKIYLQTNSCDVSKQNQFISRVFPAYKIISDQKNHHSVVT